MPTNKEVLRECKEMNLHEDDIEFIRQMREALPDEDTRAAFLALSREAPVLLKVARATKNVITSQVVVRRVFIYIVGGLVAVNLMHNEIGKFLSWAAQYFQR